MHTAERLIDQVHAAIHTSPYLYRRQLECETQEGRVILRGVVNSYFQKQMAQEILRRVDGVGEIENQLEVCWS